MLFRTFKDRLAFVLPDGISSRLESVTTESISIEEVLNLSNNIGLSVKERNWLMFADTGQFPAFKKPAEKTIGDHYSVENTEED